MAFWVSVKNCQRKTTRRAIGPLRRSGQAAPGRGWRPGAPPRQKRAAVRVARKRMPLTLKKTRNRETGKRRPGQGEAGPENQKDQSQSDRGAQSPAQPPDRAGGRRDERSGENQDATDRHERKHCSPRDDAGYRQAKRQYAERNPHEKISRIGSRIVRTSNGGRGLRRRDGHRFQSVSGSVTCRSLHPDWLGDCGSLATPNSEYFSLPPSVDFCAAP